MAIINNLTCKIIKENLNILEAAGCNINTEKLIKKIENAIPEVSCFPFKKEHLFRLSEHLRSFNMLSQGSLFTIKGAEPWMFDAEKRLEDLFQTHLFAIESCGERFIAKENKLPILLSREEALKEISISVKMVKSYVHCFGELPKIPVPIAFCSADLPFEYITPLNKFYYLNYENKEGNFLLYYSTCYPGRIKHFEMIMDGKYNNLLEKENLRAEYGSFDQWVKVICKELARWLSLGFIPAKVGYEHLGFAVKSQNISLDGGFFDIGSFYYLGDKSSFEYFEADIFEVLRWFVLTIGEHVSISLPKENILSLFISNVVKALLDAWPNKDQFKIKSVLQNIYSGGVIKLSRMLESWQNNCTIYNEDMLI